MHSSMRSEGLVKPHISISLSLHSSLILSHDQGLIVKSLRVINRLVYPSISIDQLISALNYHFMNLFCSYEIDILMYDHSFLLSTSFDSFSRVTTVEKQNAVGRIGNPTPPPTKTTKNNKITLILKFHEIITLILNIISHTGWNLWIIMFVILLAILAYYIKERGSFTGLP